VGRLTELLVSPQDEALTGRIIGAAITVHRVLGPGFLESVYHRALERELTNSGLRIETEREVTIWYDGLPVGDHRLDLIVDGQIVVELKAVSALSGAHLAQVRSYLRAVRLRIGLLLNFADAVLRVRRVVYRPAHIPSDFPDFRTSESSD
jgi:GxxExxY protein